MMKKERGQDRPQKRTVGGRSSNRIGTNKGTERVGKRKRIAGATGSTNSNRPGRFSGPRDAERSERPSRFSRQGSTERSERPNRHSGTEGPERRGNPKHFSRTERPERGERPNRFSRNEGSDRSEYSDRRDSRFGRDNRRSDNSGYRKNDRFSGRNEERGDRRQRRDGGRGVERPDSDRYLNKDGKVIRGRFGEKNLRNTRAGRTDRIQSVKREDDGSIRLNRFIANAGICSRREADTFIASGVVTVNGKPVTEMGVRVKPGDDVRFNGQRISAERKVYVLLNKPKGFVTTVDDPHADKTVMDLVRSACPERVYPVGRLDKTTTGLLLFTNDGEMTKRLTHPKYNRKKIYHVHLDKNVSKNDLQQIVDGVTLEDGFVAADSVSYVEPEDKKQVGIEIHSGKNRVVRRIFAHLGYKVEKLDRVYFCGLTKKNLPRGKWRFLSEDEVNFLKMGSF
ncbi:pseudouridine synthase [Prolixibacter sp. NT017]|uniref:pseudouridine synthase n=1 Tax=Prolixibacter sp. NT017 TaxID=2652390 RepID=UPI00188FB1D0|nr:pseudouridine synthase [Prolixibacter sp. NT017]